MALKIRLARGGAKQRPFYRIVVAEATAPRDGRFIEKLGTYNPMLEKTNPSRVILNEDRIKHWISVGAQPTDRVARFLGDAKIIPAPIQGNNPQKSQPKKKAQERLKQESDRAAEQEAAAKKAAEAPVEETPTPMAEEAPAPATTAVEEAPTPAPTETPEVKTEEEAPAPAVETTAVEEAPAPAPEESPEVKTEEEASPTEPNSTKDA